MSALRHTCRVSSGALHAPPSLQLSRSAPSGVFILRRSYASKNKTKSTSKRGPIDTSSLTPGSQQLLSRPESQAEYERASAKMITAVDWFRREAGQLDARASGRVTPQLLTSVKVLVKGETVKERVRLEDVATVGVREGSMLIVTVFESDTLKAVEDALYEAKLPNIVPQRVDERTIRIPIPKPTVDARLALYNSAVKQAEDTRMQIRRQHQASLKRGNFRKHSVELEEFQKLHDRHIGEIDTILAQIKKSTGAR